MASFSTFCAKPFKTGFVVLLLLTSSLVTGGPIAFSQTPSPTPEDQTTDTAQNDKEKRGSFVIAPIPISSPAFGSGLLIVTAYVFKLDRDDEVSPPSWVGAAGAFTNNGSRGLATGAKLN